MSGSEAMKGYGFQVHVMLLCFLEHCTNGCNFSIVGEPPKSTDIGEIVDILLRFDDDGIADKTIQVKKTIDKKTTKEVINKLIILNQDSDMKIELWFAEYTLDNKMDIIDLFDKFKTAISIEGFAENEIPGKIGKQKITISINSSIKDFTFDSNTLTLATIDTLDGDQKENIKTIISKRCDIKNDNVINRIKMILNDTLVYRRHAFVELLKPAPEIKKKILAKEYSYFDNIVIKRMGEREIRDKIINTLPDTLSPSQKEILKDTLFSLFYEASSESIEMRKSEIEQIMVGTIRELGISGCTHIDWSKRSTRGTPYSDVGYATPEAYSPLEGDFSIGGDQR